MGKRDLDEILRGTDSKLKETTVDFYEVMSEVSKLSRECKTEDGKKVNYKLVFTSDADDDYGGYKDKLYVEFYDVDDNVKFEKLIFEEYDVIISWYGNLGDAMYKIHTYLMNAETEIVNYYREKQEREAIDAIIRIYQDMKV